MKRPRCALDAFSGVGGGGVLLMCLWAPLGRTGDAFAINFRHTRRHDVRERAFRRDFVTPG